MRLRCTAAGLEKLTVEKVGEALQVSPSNPMSGLEGRAQLLIKLGKALSASPEIFGPGPGARPGNMLGPSPPFPPSFLLQLPSLTSDFSGPLTDYLSRSDSFDKSIHIADLWAIVMDGFGPVWPAARTQLDGVSLGDAWPCAALAKSLGEDKTEENSMSVFVLPIFCSVLRGDLTTTRVLQRAVPQAQPVAHLLAH